MLYMFLARISRFLFQIFVVVEFTDTNTVSIISEIWLDDGIGLWPKIDERINRTIQKHEEPGPDWKQYDVRILSKASKVSLLKQNVYLIRAGTNLQN